MVGIGGARGKAPLAMSEVRADTAANINRGALRGWALIAAAGLLLLVVLSYPDAIGMAVFGACAAAAVGVAVWLHFTLPELPPE